MGRRPGVPRASWPIATADMVGLAGQLSVALARVPFRRPWVGDASTPHNLAVAVTRETIRTFMGYASSLPIEEFRSLELVLDDLCAVAMPPVVRALDVDLGDEVVGGVPGLWYRPRGAAPAATVLYLHGGGYVGTSPRMYGAFAAWLVRETGARVFVADLRLAPEFPYPAALDDALAVADALRSDPAGGPLFLAGDSSGGGLAATVLGSGRCPVAGALLFSPEVDLLLDEPSVAANAAKDILPWNVPTAPYLAGIEPDAAEVDPLRQDLRGWPPVFCAYGSDEMFRDAIHRLVARLARAGVEVVGYEEAGMFHVFPILMPWADASRRTLREAAGFLRRHGAVPSGAAA
jgi:epsilon-lactone hydrolase